MSKIAEILEAIGKKIISDPLFKDIPIYWDDALMTRNNAHLPAIMFKVRSWSPTRGYCECERILEIRLLTATKDPKRAVLDLWDYEEKLNTVLDEAVLSPEFNFFELEKKGGSELAVMTYAKKDKDSYKTTGTLNASVIIDYYNLRYTYEV
ncbi:MAG: hypothetical protein HUJ56_11660 [Erysipelotrichaceae bacterium]|nr:hypothetical protein [Erysipelotrichaceae bacterium]